MKTVTDNGSNMVKAFKVFGKSDITNLEKALLEDENESEDDDLLPQVFPEPTGELQNNDDYELPGHERCATHTLHLVAAVDTKQARTENNACKGIHNAAFGKCQALWNLCSKSPKACETYLYITGKSVTSPCLTRWNSYYNSIKDLLCVQEHLNEVLKSLKLPLFKDQEMEFLSEYVNCMEAIAEAIQSLQGDKETYYGTLLLELMRIQRMLRCLKMENLKYCSTLVDVIDKNLNWRFKKFLQMEPSANDAILASVFHPFF